MLQPRSSNSVSDSRAADEVFVFEEDSQIYRRVVEGWMERKVEATLICTHNMKAKVKSNMQANLGHGRVFFLMEKLLNM